MLHGGDAYQTLHIELVHAHAAILYWDQGSFTCTEKLPYKFVITSLTNIMVTSQICNGTIGCTVQRQPCWLGKPH